MRERVRNGEEGGDLFQKCIFLDYYETLSQYFGGKPADALAGATNDFIVDRDWKTLFASYWKNYVGRIPARSFGNLTEAFFQLTFCDLVWRNLSGHYTSHVEPNLHSGLADFVAYPTKDDGRKICVVEFKYKKSGRGRSAKGGVRSSEKPKARAVVTAKEEAKRRISQLKEKGGLK